MKAGLRKNWGNKKYNHKIICGRLIGVGGSGEVEGSS